MIRWILLLWLLAAGSLWAQGPAGYLVHFDRKPETHFDPASYLSPAALARRARQGLPPADWYDRPVNPRYVAAVARQADSLRHVLRWFNAVSVAATPAQLARIARLPFVQATEPLGGAPVCLAAAAPPPEGYDTLLAMQRQILELDTLLAAGLSGRGVRVAVLDAGFREADTHPALAGVRRAGQVVATRDFYGDDDEVYHHSRHGTEVMSCIAGYYQDRQLGAAPDVEFLLARVEHSLFERPREEDHWLAAAEWADRLGANLINSSLGYTQKRYTYQDLDGRSTLVSRAARIATQKGILVINSAGNEGDSQWRYLGAPADVPEVLTVGGSFPMLPQRIPFSSLGPNAAGQPKPDVAAPGYVLSAWKRGRYRENAGTSFAAPLITGMAACALQRFPYLKPAQLHLLLRRSGHLYPYYDYELGHGLVQGSRLLADTLRLAPPTFRVGLQADSVILAIDTTQTFADSARFPHGRVLYFHLENEQGQLETSQSVRLPNDARYYYFRRRREAEGLLRIWFEGYLFETRIEPLGP